MKKITKKITKKSAKKIKQNKGFIILFAMLISSLILLISSGIYNIVQKQVVLSSYARESQKAFFAADAAVDCALFNDISPLIAQTAFSVDGLTTYPVDITCGGGTTKVSLLNSTTGSDNFDFPFVFRYFGLQNSGGSYLGSGCSYVLVEKKGLVGDPIQTRITASGFNVCMEGSIPGIYDTPDFNNPLLLERRLSVTYNAI